MNKAELIEAMASHAGLSKRDAVGVLDAIVAVATKTLVGGDSVALVGFGSFSVPKRARRRGRGDDGSAVDFEACPSFAAAVGIAPGRSGERRPMASSRCADADVVIDAERIARETGRRDGHGLSKADAKRALEGFVDATAGALGTGDRVSLVGFGSFSISKRSARTGRNPQTGKEIKISARYVEFKAGAELSKAVE